MKAVIFCGDFTFAAKVRSTLLRIGRREDVGVRWNAKAWPLSALNHSAMAEKILEDASDAHLVVISIEHAGKLPDPLRDWLEKWGALSGIRARAVGVINGRDEQPFRNASLHELRLLLEKHDLHLVTDMRRLQHAAPGLVASFSEEAKQQITLTRAPQSRLRQRRMRECLVSSRMLASDAISCRHSEAPLLRIAVFGFVS